MKNAIVTTTINPPTESLLKYSQMSDYDLIVVGDLKTPHNLYKDINCIYLDPQYQESNYKDLSDLIGWNCIQRRNFGFIYAYLNNYPLIITSDDDNTPLDNWGKKIYLDREPIELTKLTPREGIILDPISCTEYKKLWHRGFPIQLLHNRDVYEDVEYSTFEIQANFWNGDPDIDAICRMEHKPDCIFSQQNFPFYTDCYSPFNSQNTILKRSVLPHYFMFPFIGRMDDIWASYYVESLGYNVIYGEATVRQDRNDHDLTKDFEKEILGYTKTLELVHSLDEDPNNLKNFVPERSWLAFQEYQRIMND